MTVNGYAWRRNNAASGNKLYFWPITSKILAQLQQKKHLAQGMEHAYLASRMRLSVFPENFRQVFSGPGFLPEIFVQCEESQEVEPGAEIEGLSLRYFACHLKKDIEKDIEKDIGKKILDAGMALVNSALPLNVIPLTRIFILISLILAVLAIVCGAVWRPFTETILRLLYKNESLVLAWTNRYHPSEQEFFISLVPYFILGVVILCYGYQKKSPKAQAILSLFGFFGASILPMLVQIPTLIYRYSPNARYGGYTGDAITTGLAWMGSFVALVVGLAVGLAINARRERGEQLRG